MTYDEPAVRITAIDDDGERIGEWTTTENGEHIQAYRDGDSWNDGYTTGMSDGRVPPQREPEPSLDDRLQALTERVTKLEADRDKDGWPTPPGISPSRPLDTRLCGQVDFGDKHSSHLWWDRGRYVRCPGYYGVTETDDTIGDVGYRRVETVEVKDGRV